METDPNPYESPGDAPARQSTCATARSQLLPAALGLLVTSILHVAGGLFYFVYVYQVSLDADPDVTQTLLVYCMYYGITMLYSLVLASGAFSMLRLRSYVWAMAVCVLALVPFFGPCWIAAVPFGLWGIIVLRRPDVRGAFAKA